MSFWNYFKSTAVYGALSNLDGVSEPANFVTQRNATIGGNLNVSGSTQLTALKPISIITVNANATLPDTISSQTTINCVTGVGNYTVTLPNPINGWLLYFSNYNSNTTILQSPVGATIYFENPLGTFTSGSSLTLVHKASLIMYCDGANYYVLFNSGLYTQIGTPQLQYDPLTNTLTCLSKFKVNLGFEVVGTPVIFPAGSISPAAIAGGVYPQCIAYSLDSTVSTSVPPGSQLFLNSGTPRTLLFPVPNNGQGTFYFIQNQGAAAWTINKTGAVTALVSYSPANTGQTGPLSVPSASSVLLYYDGLNWNVMLNTVYQFPFLGANNTLTGNNTLNGTTIFGGNLSANSQTITPTQLGYVSGATSNIQSQINAIKPTVTVLSASAGLSASTPPGTTIQLSSNTTPGQILSLPNPPTYGVGTYYSILNYSAVDWTANITGGASILFYIDSAGSRVSGVASITLPFGTAARVYYQGSWFVSFNTGLQFPWLGKTNIFTGNNTFSSNVILPVAPTANAISSSMILNNATLGWYNIGNLNFSGGATYGTMVKLQCGKTFGAVVNILVLFTAGAVSGYYWQEGDNAQLITGVVVSGSASPITINVQTAFPIIGNVWCTGPNIVSFVPNNAYLGTGTPAGTAFANAFTVWAPTTVSSMTVSNGFTVSAGAVSFPAASISAASLTGVSLAPTVVNYNTTTTVPTTLPSGSEIICTGSAFTLTLPLSGVPIGTGWWVQSNGATYTLSATGSIQYQGPGGWTVSNIYNVTNGTSVFIAWSGTYWVMFYSGLDFARLQRNNTYTGSNTYNGQVLVNNTSVSLNNTGIIFSNGGTISNITPGIIPYPVPILDVTQKMWATVTWNGVSYDGGQVQAVGTVTKNSVGNLTITVNATRLPSFCGYATITPMAAGVVGYMTSTPTNGTATSVTIQLTNLAGIAVDANFAIMAF